MEKKLKIKKINPILKFKLKLWDRYKGKDIDGYEKILNYVSVRGVEAYVYGFKHKDEDSLFDSYSILSKQQEHHAYVLEEKGKIKSFMYFRLDDEKTNKPRMYIQAIATHPLYQHQGYATEFMNTILKNPTKFMSVKPITIYGLVDTGNFECHNFFQKFGETTKEYIGMDFYRVDTTINYDEIVKREK